MNNDNRIELVANHLVEKLHSPQSWEFYCKVAYALDQPTINRLLATAIEKGRNPGGLFNYLSRKEMELRTTDGKGNLTAGG